MSRKHRASRSQKSWPRVNIIHDKKGKVRGYEQKKDKESE